MRKKILLEVWNSEDEKCAEIRPGQQHFHSQVCREQKNLKTLNKKLWGAGEPTNFLLEVFVGPLSFTVFL